MAVALTAGGCAGLAPAAKSVAKSTIRGTYDEIDAIDPALQDRVTHKLIDTPAVRDAAHDLSSAMLSGAIDGLTESERAGKINAFINASLDAMRKAGDAATAELIDRMSEKLSPMLRSLIEDLVASASAAMRDAAAHDLPVIVSAVMDSVMRGFAMSATAASEQMRAGAKDFAERDLGPIAGAISEQVARQAVVGVREGIHQALDLKDPAVRDGMREIGAGLAQGIAQGTPASPFATTFALASFVLGALLLLAIGAIVALHSRDRANAKVIDLLLKRTSANDGQPLAKG